MVKRVNNGRKLTEGKEVIGISMALLVQALDSGLLDNDLARELEIVNRDYNLGNYTISRICYYIMKDPKGAYLDGNPTKDLNIVLRLANEMSESFGYINNALEHFDYENPDNYIIWLETYCDKLDKIISKLNSYKSKYED